METKICNACKEAIHAEATKCPKCQSFQSKYLNPNFVSLLWLLFIPLLLIPIWNSTYSEKINYMDHKDKISVNILRTDTLQRDDCENCNLLNILVELDNKTDIEWEQGNYEIEFKTIAGELLNLSLIHI